MEVNKIWQGGVEEEGAGAGGSAAFRLLTTQLSASVKWNSTTDK